MSGERDRLARRAAGGDLGAARKLVAMLEGADPGSFNARAWLVNERRMLEEAVLRDRDVLLDIDRWPAWVEGIWDRLFRLGEAELLEILATVPDAIRDEAKLQTTATDIEGSTISDIVRDWARWAVALHASEGLPRIQDHRGEAIPRDLYAITHALFDAEDVDRIMRARWWRVDGHEGPIFASVSETSVDDSGVSFPEDVGIDDMFDPSLVWRRVPDSLKRHGVEGFYSA